MPKIILFDHDKRVRTAVNVNPSDSFRKILHEVRKEYPGKFREPGQLMFIQEVDQTFHKIQLDECIKDYLRSNIITFYWRKASPYVRPFYINGEVVKSRIKVIHIATIATLVIIIFSLFFITNGYNIEWKGIKPIFRVFNSNGGGQYQNRRLNDIVLNKIYVCRNIINREPYGIQSTFDKTIKKIYCFTSFKSSVNSFVYHKWYYKNKLVATVKLRVGVSTNWRTFSSKNIQEWMVGQWKVEVVDRKGKKIGEIELIIK